MIAIANIIFKKAVNYHHYDCPKYMQSSLDLFYITVINCELTPCTDDSTVAINDSFILLTMQFKAIESIITYTVV